MTLLHTPIIVCHVGNGLGLPCRWRYYHNLYCWTDLPNGLNGRNEIAISRNQYRFIVNISKGQLKHRNSNIYVSSFLLVSVKNLLAALACALNKSESALNYRYTAIPLNPYKIKMSTLLDLVPFSISSEIIDCFKRVVAISKTLCQCPIVQPTILRVWSPPLRICLNKGVIEVEAINECYNSCHIKSRATMRGGAEPLVTQRDYDILSRL